MELQPCIIKKPAFDSSTETEKQKLILPFRLCYCNSSKNLKKNHIINIFGCLTGPLLVSHRKWEPVHSRRRVSIPTGLCSHICSHNPGSTGKDSLVGKKNLTKKKKKKNRGSVGNIIKCCGARGGRRRGMSREKEYGFRMGK